MFAAEYLPAVSYITANLANLIKSSNSGVTENATTCNNKLQALQALRSEVSPSAGHDNFKTRYKLHDACVRITVRFIFRFT